MGTRSFMSAVRKWSRPVHRDLSFFFSGVLLIYAVSGFMLNHKRDFNSDYSVRRTELVFAQEIPRAEQEWTRARAEELLLRVGEEGNYLKHYFPEPDRLKVFIRGGSSLTVDLASGTRRLRVDPQAARAEQSEPAALQSVALVDGLFGCLFSGIDRNRAFRAGDDARPERIAGPRRRRADRGDSDSAAVYFPDLIRETACDKRADVENVRPSLAYGFVVIVLPCRIPAAGRRGRVRTRRRRRSARAVRRAICGG